MTIRDVLNSLTEQLNAAGISSARLDGQMILEISLGRDRTWIAAHDENRVSKKQMGTVSKLLTQRLNYVPMALLKGSVEFYGLDFFVNRRVLIPRPESEVIVEYVIKHASQGASILDMGTGSGALTVSVKKNRPDTVQAASDISLKALSLARRNAAAHKTTINFIHSNMWKDIPGTFDVVMANLPYLKTDQKVSAETKHEPASALYSGKDGLVHYRRFFARLHDHLSPDGFAVIECEKDQVAALKSLAGGLTHRRLSNFVSVFHREIYKLSGASARTTAMLISCPSRKIVSVIVSPT